MWEIFCAGIGEKIELTIKDMEKELYLKAAIAKRTSSPSLQTAALRIHKEIKNGHEVRLLLMETYGGSIKRVCRSTHAAEANAFLMATMCAPSSSR